MFLKIRTHSMAGCVTLYNYSIKGIKKVKLADFQYKINNKILVTNSFLFKIKKINNKGCSYCNEHSETMEHLFLNCTKVIDFWNSLQDWLSNNCNITLHLEEKSLIFSSQKLKSIENFILYPAKYYTYIYIYMFFNMKPVSHIK